MPAANGVPSKYRQFSEQHLQALHDADLPDRYLLIIDAPITQESGKILKTLPAACSIINMLHDGDHSDAAIPGIVQWRRRENSAPLWAGKPTSHAVMVGRFSDLRLWQIRAAIRNGIRKFQFMDPVSISVTKRHAYSVLLSRIIDMFRVVTVRAAWSAARAMSDHSSPLRFLYLPAARIRRRLAQRLPRWHRIFNAFLDSAHDTGLPATTADKRVLFTIGTLGSGGSERQLVNTAIALKKAGIYEPVVSCMKLSDKHSRFYLPMLEENGIRVIDASQIIDNGLSQDAAKALTVIEPSISGVNETLKWDIIRMYLVMMQESPMIVHSFLDDTNVKAGLAAVAADVDLTILSVRSVAPDNFALLQNYMRPIYKLLLKKKNVVLCANSQAGIDDYRRWLQHQGQPMSLIYNGMDLSLLIEQEEDKKWLRQTYSIPDNALVLGSVMRLTEEKGPLLWARMVVDISRRLPNVHFVLVGDGPLRPEVESIITSARITRRVHLVGRTQQVGRILTELDLFVLTSRMEGLPNALIEAQAAGVAVVTTPAGGAPEAVSKGTTGSVAPGFGITDLSDECVRLLECPQTLGTMGKNGPAFVKQKFGLQRAINETMSLYEDNLNLAEGSEDFARSQP